MKRIGTWRAGMVPALMLGAGALSSIALAGCGKSGASGGGDALATVGGETVTRDELRDYLEGTQAVPALHALIDYDLLMEQLKAKNLEITDADVQAEIQRTLGELKKQEGNTSADNKNSQSKLLEQVIAAGGPRLLAVQRSTRQQLALEKLLTQDIKPTQTDIQKYFEANRMRYDDPSRVEAGMLIASTRTRAATMLAQLRNKSRSFAQLVTEQKAAKDPVAHGSVAQTPPVSTAALPAAFASLGRLKPGQFSDIVILSPPPRPAFGILTVISATPAKKADFKALQSRIEREYKLEQVARRQVPPPGTDPRTFNPLATAQENLMQKLRKNGSVKITDPLFAPVAEDYKLAASADTTPGAPADAVPAAPAAPPARSAPAPRTAPASRAATPKPVAR